MLLFSMRKVKVIVLLEFLDADEHIATLDFVMSLYEKSSDWAIALVGDNCPTNRSMATKLQIPFIGCASHLWNLWVEDYLKEYAEHIKVIHFLMTELKTPRNAAILREKTPLVAINIPQNRTRWGIQMDMIERYLFDLTFLDSRY